jgi:hypothetical protein
MYNFVLSKGIWGIWGIEELFKYGFRPVRLLLIIKLLREEKWALCRVNLKLSQMMNF